MPDCTTCHHAKWKRTSDGRLHPSGVGHCSWDGWKQLKLPLAMQVIVSLAGEDIMKPRGGYINRHKCVYKNCPLYKPLKRSFTTLIT